MPAPQYLLALDYGTVRTGVAIANSVARLPRPLTTLLTSDDIYARIAQIVADEQVGLVVVGLPRTMDGGYSKQTHAAEAFATELRTVLTVPVELADETLSSVDAEAELAGKQYDKGMVDALAAAYILERYIADHPEVSAHA